MKWIKVNEEDEKPLFEVVAFHPDWIDLDFNPNGIRIGFFTDAVFISARWNDSQDSYIADDSVVPIFYHLALDTKGLIEESKSTA